MGDFENLPEFAEAFETFHDERAPTHLEILERAVRLGSEAMRGVLLQTRRLAASEPEDEEWPLRLITDFRFFVVELWRLRSCALLAMEADPIVSEAIHSFDRQLPSLAAIRNVDQHIDEYARDVNRKQKDSAGKPIGRRKLEVWNLSGPEFTWLSHTVDTGKATGAAQELYGALRGVRDKHRPDLM